MEAIVCARTVKAIAAAIALPLLSGCAGLRLDQGPDQVIQRTEGEDNYNQRQKAGPVDARVLPYALLAEQSYDSLVYLTRKATRRTTAYAADDPKDCDARAEDQRATRWLNEWRYVWSCETPDQCGVRTAGESEPVGGLGVQIWARKGVGCPEVVIAFRGTVGGRLEFGHDVQGDHALRFGGCHTAIIRQQSSASIRFRRRSLFRADG